MTLDELVDLMKDKGFAPKFYKWRDIPNFVNQEKLVAFILHQPYGKDEYTIDTYIHKDDPNFWNYGKEYLLDPIESFVKALEKYEESLDI